MRGSTPKRSTVSKSSGSEKRPGRHRTLPVAALPLRGGEEYLVRRGKRRPCLILASTEVPVDASVARGKRRWQTALTRLVMPYYSANGTPARAGWSPELVVRIRRCEYPQYFWRICLCTAHPKAPSCVSIMHSRSATISPTSSGRVIGLHPDALGILEDWFAWYVTGTLAQSSTISAARELLCES